jgi:AcrR family transcriptional regulator
MTAAVEAPRPTRRDAVRNRERILKAASIAFADKGLDVSMDAVAAAAGVGVGTVYRHFPRREHLVAALFDDRVDEVVEMAREAGEDPDAWHGLTSFLERAIELELGDRALAQVLEDPSLRARLLVRGTEDIRPPIDSLVRRAQAHGDLRRDIEATDFVLVKRAVTEVAAATRETAPDAWRRMLALLLDGLSHTEGQELPGEALTPLQASGLHGYSG